MGTSSPVFGFRPMRWLFWRTANVPNDESLTVSPRANAEQTSSSMSSTICADSLRDSPTAWNTASVRSARVNVFVVITRLPQNRSDVRRASFLRQHQRDRSGSSGGGSPPDQAGAPGKAAAHGFEQDELALVDAAVLNRGR